MRKFSHSFIPRSPSGNGYACVCRHRRGNIGGGGGNMGSGNSSSLLESGMDGVELQ